MSSNSSQAATKPTTKPTNPSRLFGPSNSRNPGRGMTSNTIANDIAAFKKNGGRIEVLGNTPFRTHSPAATFRSKTTPQRKTPAAPSKAAARN